MDFLMPLVKQLVRGSRSNRLASNSLLESLAFAKRAAKDLVAGRESVSVLPKTLAELDLLDYQDAISWQTTIKK